MSELAAATRATPYRERRWALLVLGYYRTGRQAEALGALREVRALLAEELGVDPSPRLQELERRVLAQDPDLTGAEPVPGDTGRAARPLTSFVGRHGEPYPLPPVALRGRPEWSKG